MAISIFLAGSATGALSLRAWQKSKIQVIAEPKLSWPDFRRQALALAPRPAVVMLGDSITEWGPWAEIMSCTSVANWGIKAETSGDILARVDEVVALKPRLVFLLVGTNDIRFQIRPEETASNIRRIVERLEGAKVVVHPVIPLEGAGDRVEKLNRLIEASLQNTRATIIPLPITMADLSDGIHLLPDAYRKWRDVIAPLACE